MKIDDTLIAHTDPVLLADLAPYQLLREIGRGGMSVVYEACDVRTGQRVALKVLSLPFAATAARRSELVARFRREERAVAQLSHPNIVAIWEIGERAGLHFIAMEYLPGEALRTRLERGPLALPEAGRVLTQIAAALAAVHAAGIVHRDVKPSNVMLLPDGAAKLLDFGVARHSDDTAITSGGLVVGSPAYLSPEQVRGGFGTQASDVWALGVLLHEMLTGHPPFRATDVAAVMYQVIHEPPRPVPGLPPALAKVLKRALDKDPARRFPSAQALAEAFTAALPAERAVSAPLAARTPASPPRWLWGLPPLLFLAAALGSFYSRHPLPPPAQSVRRSAPVSAPNPVPPPLSVPESTPAAAVPRTKPPRRLLPVSPAAVSPAAVFSVRRFPPVRRPRPAPLSSAARSIARTVRPAPVQAAAPPRPAAVAARLLPHPRPHPRPPAPDRAEAAASLPVSAAPPPAALRAPAPRISPPKPAPSKTDEDAEEAARLQKFIWSEGR